MGPWGTVTHDTDREDGLEQTRYSSAFIIQGTQKGNKTPTISVWEGWTEPEVELLIEQEKRDALKMTKQFGVQIGCVITRCTVRGNE